MKTLLVHGNEGDPRVNAFVERRVKEDPDLKPARGSKDSPAPIKAEEADEFEAIVSAELPKVQEIAAAYKALGVTVAIIGKQGPPPEGEANAVEVKDTSDAQADES